VWWVAYYHRGQEIRESAKTTSEQKAERLLRERLRTAGCPDFIGPAAERLTFDDLATMYLDDFKVNGKRSLPDAKRNVKTLRGTFGSWKAIDITTDAITAYTARRLTPSPDAFAPPPKAVRPATVNRELSALKRMFALAIRAGKLANRPHVPMLAEENAREGFLEPADFAVLASHLPAWLADAATFAYLTGWRRGEVATLEWRDVSLSAREIRLRSEHSKTKRPRVVKLTGELLVLIERRAAGRRLDVPLVFHRDDSEPLGDFRTAWAAACTAAGHPGLLVHDLRRSAVRNMVRAGVPERVAMAISGHRTRAIFDRYNIVSEDDLVAAAA
jgi:integrase